MKIRFSVYKSDRTSSRDELIAGESLMKRYESAALLCAGSLISGRWVGSCLKCLQWVCFEAAPVAVIPRCRGRGTFANEAPEGTPSLLVPGAGWVLGAPEGSDPMPCSGRCILSR